MTKYVAQHKGQKVSVVSLGGLEYHESGGYIEIPDNHRQAHSDAALAGLEKETKPLEITTKTQVKEVPAEVETDEKVEASETPLRGRRGSHNK
jgi:hypothetical protein